MSKLVQVELHSKLAKKVGYKVMMSWVENRPDLKIGCRITLKDTEEPERLWTVMSIGPEHDRSDIKRGWGMTDYFVKEGERAR